MSQDQTSSFEARFRVVRLTTDALLRQCRVDDFEEWGAPTMDLAQYLQREEQLMHSHFTRSSGSFWALVERVLPSDSPASQDDEELTLQDGDKIPELCVHCEIYRFDCLLRKADGTIVRGYSHHIGSVFTLPSWRKQGLAAFFLKQIAAKTAAQSDAIGSVLYSDIGPKYYDKLGWRCHESRIGSVYVADPKNAAALELSASGFSKGEPLYLDAALDELLVRDRQLLEAELFDAKYADQEVFVPVATREPIEWQFLTGVYHLALQGHNEALIKQCGLKVDDNAFIVWRHHPKDSALYILRSRFPETSSDACRTLLSAALIEARKFDLKCVKIWDPPACLAHTSRLQIEYQVRESSLSSAMIFAHHRPTPSSALLIWLANEKFAWV